MHGSIALLLSLLANPLQVSPGRMQLQGFRVMSCFKFSLAFQYYLPWSMRHHTCAFLLHQTISHFF